MPGVHGLRGRGGGHRHGLSCFGGRRSPVRLASSPVDPCRVKARKQLAWAPLGDWMPARSSVRGCCGGMQSPPTACVGLASRWLPRWRACQRRSGGAQLRRLSHCDGPHSQLTGVGGHEDRCVGYCGWWMVSARFPRQVWQVSWRRRTFCGLQCCWTRSDAQHSQLIGGAGPGGQRVVRRCLKASGRESRSQLQRRRSLRRLNGAGRSLDQCHSCERHNWRTADFGTGGLRQPHHLSHLSACLRFVHGPNPRMHLSVRLRQDSKPGCRITCHGWPGARFPRHCQTFDLRSLHICTGCSTVKTLNRVPRRLLSASSHEATLCLHLDGDGLCCAICQILFHTDTVQV